MAQNSSYFLSDLCEQKEGGHMTELKDRLDSWKEIANYVDRDIVTCWRWAKKHGNL
jgi:hypothetical protein